MSTLILMTAPYKCDLCGDTFTKGMFSESTDLGFCMPCHQGPKCLAVHEPSGDTCLQRVGHRDDHGQLFSNRWPKVDLETANEVP
jgi:hypothetical protein